MKKTKLILRSYKFITSKNLLLFTFAVFLGFMLGIKTPALALDAFEGRPIVLAVKRGDIQGIKDSIAKGEEASLSSSYDVTLLLVSLWSDSPNKTEVIKFLLENGADEVVGHGFGEYSSRLYPITEASSQKEYEIVKLLLKYKADVNVVDRLEMTPLLYAIKNNDIKMLKILIENGADVNYFTLLGTPYSYAVQNKRDEIAKILKPLSNAEDAKALYEIADSIGSEIHDPNKNTSTKVSIETVKLLLKLGAKPNKTPKVFYDFARNKKTEEHINVVTVLLQNGANPNVEVNGNPLLITAIKDKFSDLALVLLKHGAKVDITNERGSTALSFAAYNGDASLCQALLSHGADVNLLNKFKSAPINYAFMSGDVKTINLLIKNGANAKNIGEFGETVLYNSIYSGKLDAVKLASKYASIDQAQENNVTPLILAAQNGHADIVAFLLDSGANINHKGGVNKLPAIIPAANNGKYEVVELLIKRGADIEATSKDGRTALSFAAQNNHYKTVELLLLNGANIETTDKWGNTPLMYASSNGEYATVETLLENYAKINIKNKEGKTALDMANDNSATAKTLKNPDIFYAELLRKDILENNIENISKALERGVNVDAQDSDGLTLLAVAARRGHLELVKLLLKHGADVNKKDHRGMPAFADAITKEEHSIAILKLFIDKGANIHKPLVKGFTMLMGAIEEGDLEILKFLVEQGVDLNARNDKGESALDMAKGDDELFDYLKSKGAK